MDPFVNTSMDLSADSNVDDQIVGSLATQDATGPDGTSLSFRANRADERRPGDLVARKNRSRTLWEKAGALAGIASVTAIVFTVLLCGFSYYHKTGQLIVGRKLSSDGDSSDEDAVVFCQEAYAESEKKAFQALEEGQASEEALLPPAAKVARLGTGLELGAASSEGGRGKMPQSRPSVLRYAPPRPRAEAAPSGYGGVPGRNTLELEAASGLLGLQHSPEAKDQPSTSSQPSAGHPPFTVGPRSGAPSLVSEVLTPSATPSASSHLSREVMLPHPQEGGAGSRPSTALGLSVADEALASHPFFRLPLADRVDVLKPRFSPLMALSLLTPGRPVATLINDLRLLLVKDKLSAENLDQLSDLTHCLMSVLYRSESSSQVGKAKKLSVIVLARRFLGLDVVISALQVLGVTPSGDWWDQFTSAISHEHTPGVRPKGRTETALFNGALADELVRGISILKTGVRLPPEETVNIKRMLFCLPHSPPSFRQSLWDMWRLDNEEFRRLRVAASLGAPPQQ